MSGKTSPAHITIASRSFYSESPPKKSRLQDNNNIRPPFKTFKDQLVNFDKKLSEPINSPGPKEPEQIAISATTLSRSTDTNVETKSLDRESPIPLKNLGNTCYENSIIQCLFSLEMFMENFERSMKLMREFVVKARSEAPGQAQNDANQSQEQQQLDKDTLNAPIIPEDDVRFRIADAFDNLYKSYTHKRLQAETNAPDQMGSGNKDVIIQPQKLPGQQPQQEQEEPELLPLRTQPSTETISAQASQNLTPIALISSATSTNEQSEIETRLEELKSAVGDRSSQFNSAHQQDASEFFYHVIDSIQEFYQSLNRNNDDDNPVTKAFELELDYLIKCPKCHHKIITGPEKIRTLPLALPHFNNESLTNHTDDYNQDINRIPTPPTSDLGLDSPESSGSEERRNGSEEKENQALSNDILDINHLNSNNTNDTMSISKLDLTDKAYQSNSHTKQNYTLCDALNNYFKDDILEYKCSQPDCDSMQRTKKCLIRKLPQILFITLARYSYTGKKNLDEIEAPFELAVPFQENKSPSHSTHKEFSDNDNKYQLVAVVCHLGSSLNAGHYTSYVYNQNNFSWYSCDDDSIVKVQEVEVKNDASKSGYCFFYAHKSSINRNSQSHKQLVSQKYEHDKLERTEAIVREAYMIDTSTILTPESSPSPTAISQEDSGFNSDVNIINIPNQTDNWS